MDLIHYFLKLLYASTSIEVFVKPLRDFLYNVLFCFGKGTRIKTIRYDSIGPLFGEGYSTTSGNDLGNGDSHVISEQNLGSIRLFTYMIEGINEKLKSY